HIVCINVCSRSFAMWVEAIHASYKGALVGAVTHARGIEISNIASRADEPVSHILRVNVKTRDLQPCRINIVGLRALEGTKASAWSVELGDRTVARKAKEPVKCCVRINVTSRNIPGLVDGGRLGALAGNRACIGGVEGGDGAAGRITHKSVIHAARVT